MEHLQHQSIENPYHSSLLTKDSQDIHLELLLKNPDNIQRLLYDGNMIGLNFFDHANNNLLTEIDVSNIYRENLPYEIEDLPEGYNDYADLSARKRLEIAFKVYLASRISDFTITGFKILPQNEEKDFNKPYLSVNFDRDNLIIKSGDSIPIDIRIKIHDKYEGSIQKFIVFFLKGEYHMSPAIKVETSCCIGLRFKGNIMSIATRKQLSSDARPFVPVQLREYFDVKWKKYSPLTGQGKNLIVCKPPTKYAMALKTLKEKEYRASNEIIHCYIKSMANNNVDKLFSIYSVENIFKIPMQDPNNLQLIHLKSQSLLTMAEDIQMERDILQYDLYYENIAFEKYQGFFVTCKIIVKGLNESRPKLSIGDHLLLRPSFEDMNALNLGMFEMIGIISSTKLATEEVIMICHLPTQVVSTIPEILRICNSIKFHIRFTYQRYGLIFIQEAIRDIIGNYSLLECLTFPTKRVFLENFKFNLISNASPLESNSNKNWNPEQLYAIQHISQSLLPIAKELIKTGRRLPPFIIHGPPGTGKTSVLIEALKQLLHLYPTANILCCAPSDAAADVLCERLRLEGFNSRSQLFRLNWWQRLPDSCSNNVLAHSIQDTNGLFELPNISYIESRIIVATCGCSGILKYIANTLFDVVIVDEVSQATEAEVYIPLSLCKPSGIMILAGDPMQLGAETRSFLYKMNHNGLSIQERLMNLPLYQEKNENLNLQLCIFLKSNYRSPLSMLQVPSRLFYKNQMQSLVPDEKYQMYLNWSVLPSPFPLLFVGVNGDHNHAIDSPSFYNIFEVNKIVDIVKSLMNEKEKLNITTQSIGIIGGFRSQVLKIRQALRAAGLGAVNVGGVEDYQGQEREIIIISTVLSHRVTNYERQGSLGLFGDNRRFNVAVTRGKGLCIVIGNPNYLYLDNNWREYMEHCDSQLACIGYECKLLKRYQDEVKSTDDMLSNLTLQVLGEGFDSGNEYQFNNFDMPWRINL